MVAEEGYDKRWHHRIEAEVERLHVTKVSGDLYASERERMRKDIDANEQAIDRFFAERSRERQVAIWQLVSTFLSLLALIGTAIAIVVSL
jgi:hypothetical protein